MDASVRLIAIDIDGTLLPGVHGPVSERNRQALLEAEAAGIEIAIATGRRHSYALKAIDQIGLKPSTYILSANGATTRRLSGEMIEGASMEIEVARRLVPMLRGLGITVFTFEDEDGPMTSRMVTESVEPIHPRIDLWVRANRDHIEAVTPLENALRAELPAGRLLVQGMCAGTMEDVLEAERRVLSGEIAERLAVHRTEYTEWNIAFLDLMPEGISKGYALSRLAARLSIRREQVMAMGDNWNDLAMLEFAGYPVLMGNALPEMHTLARERGWQVTASNNDDGVAMAVEAAVAGSIK